MPKLFRQKSQQCHSPGSPSMDFSLCDETNHIPKKKGGKGRNQRFRIFRLLSHLEFPTDGSSQVLKDSSHPWPTSQRAQENTSSCLISIWTPCILLGFNSQVQTCPSSVDFAFPWNFSLASSSSCLSPPTMPGLEDELSLARWEAEHGAKPG